MRPRSLAGAAAALAALVVAVRLAGPRSAGAPQPALQAPPAAPSHFEPSPERPAPEPQRLPERPPLPAPVPEPALRARSESPGLRGGDLSFYAPEGVPADMSADGRLLFKWWFAGFSYEPRRGSGYIVDNRARVTLDGKDLGFVRVPRRESKDDRSRWLKVPAGDPQTPHLVEIRYVDGSESHPLRQNRIVVSREAGAGKPWKRVLWEFWYEGGDPAIFKRTIHHFPQ